MASCGPTQLNCLFVFRVEERLNPSPKEKVMCSQNVLHLFRKKIIFFREHMSCSLVLDHVPCFSGGGGEGVSPRETENTCYLGLF